MDAYSLCRVYIYCYVSGVSACFFQVCDDFYEGALVGAEILVLFQADSDLLDVFVLYPVDYRLVRSGDAFG